MNLWSIAAEILDPQKLKNNQFVTAAIIAAPATAITYALRSVPKRSGVLAQAGDYHHSSLQQRHG
jgi:hypothetical protein